MMRYSYFSSTVAAGLALACVGSIGHSSREPGQAQRAPSVARMSQLLGQAPIRFESNQGQLDPQVRYYSRGPAYTLYLTSQEAVLSFAQGKPVRISLSGAKAEPAMDGLDPMTSSSTYLVGNRRDSWQGKVPHYRKVRYREVYPGIDMLYYGKDRQVEYDFVVSPGADPDRIRMRFDGADRVRLDADGTLLVDAGETTLRQPRPLVRQEPRGDAVEADYVLLDDGEVGFTVGEYDRDQTLIIDPVLYSTFLGGNGDETAIAVASGAAGTIWVAGTTRSTTFPARGEPVSDAAKGFRDIFLARIDPSKPGDESLVYSTYIGGSNDDELSNMSIDARGMLYLTGYTASADFPIAGNTYQTTPAGERDAFVVQFNPNEAGAAALSYASYLGGTGDEVGQAVAADASGRIYVVGFTASADFPNVAAMQGSNRGGWETFIAIYDPSQAATGSLVYSSYYGGGGTDVATGVAVDAVGRVYVTGYTTSNDFPLGGDAYQPEYRGAGDIFLARFNFSKPGLDAIEYSTYLGGGRLDLARDIVLDSAGDVLLTGYTLSGDLPLAGGPLQEINAGGADVFLIKLRLDTPAASALRYGTYLGGSGDDVAYKIVLDQSGRVYLGGYTTSIDFPLRANPAQGQSGGGAADGFAARVDFSRAGPDALTYTTYFGGSLSDVVNGIAVDSAGNISLAGFTLTRAFPIGDAAFQPNLAGPSDAFVAKLSP